MDKGWIKLSRKLLDSAIWNANEPFTIRDAWIDLLLSVNYEDREMFTKHGKIIKIPRGSMFTSIKHLADRWHWSPNKVRRYIGKLTGEHMAHIVGTADGTLLTIEKYRDFQDGWRTDGTADGRTDGTADGTRLKNNKNKKKERSVCAPASLEEKYAAIERNSRKRDEEDAL